LLKVLRDDHELELDIVPDGVDEKEKIVGKIQASIPVSPEMVMVRYGFIASLGQGVTRSWETTTLTLSMLGNMFTGKVSVKNIAGPISIADYAGQTARAGFIRYMHFLAFLSISIGIVNLLPIPVLDGGFLLYYAVEAITGKTVSDRLSEIMQKIGLVLIMMLLVVAVFNDVTRFFR
jgi:regulator of sigma E protease